MTELLPALKGLEEGLGARLDAVHGVVAALESEESHLNSTTKELGAKVGALSDALAPVDDRLDTIERTVQELAGEVRTLRETLVGVKDDLQRTTGLRGGPRGGGTCPRRPHRRQPRAGQARLRRVWGWTMRSSAGR